MVINMGETMGIYYSNVKGSVTENMNVAAELSLRVLLVLVKKTDNF
jgi:hypothetical protein